ncbi:MAG: hypothetical protein CBC09_00300 [Cellvibrionales bacterium TMED49]|nr:hypothetical protein [Porticoccaceae bacterium]OUU40641.1 MAG: hypothetical protein CBC09_00300 [Cellvibrionales bacterium TMED49]|tara:strand:- start:321 stop:1109 length:789 start_codon:yes stop_codon:yes gene_type:complete
MTNKLVRRLTILVLAVTYVASTWANQNQTKISLEAVGTIFCDGAIRGTASHVHHERKEHSIVLTAAHVLFDPTTRSAFRTCSYRASNARFQNFPISKISTPRKILQDSYALEGMKRDWVFASLNNKLYAPALQLRRDLQESLPSTKKNLSITMLAYDKHADKIRKIEDCGTMQSYNIEDPSVLIHNCGHGSGFSGAPLLDTRTRELLGVHGGRLVLSKPPNDNIVDILGQARLIDNEVLNELRRFSASLRYHRKIDTNQLEN